MDINLNHRLAAMGINCLFQVQKKSQPKVSGEKLPGLAPPLAIKLSKTECHEMLDKMEPTSRSENFSSSKITDSVKKNPVVKSAVNELFSIISSMILTKISDIRDHFTSDDTLNKPKKSDSIL